MNNLHQQDIKVVTGGCDVAEDDSPKSVIEQITELFTR